MRKFFDPETVFDRRSIRVYSEDIFTEAEPVETAHEYAAFWWDENGYPGTHLDTPRFSTAARYYNGFSAEHESDVLRPVLTMYVSLMGQQAVYVAAGADRTPVIEADEHRATTEHSARIEETRQRVRRVPSEGSYRLHYDSIGALLPGDVAVVMGHPSHARVGLRSKRGSEYAILQYSFNEGLSSRKRADQFIAPIRPASEADS